MRFVVTTLGWPTLFELVWSFISSGSLVFVVRRHFKPRKLSIFWFVIRWILALLWFPEMFVELVVFPTVELALARVVVIPFPVLLFEEALNFRFFPTTPESRKNLHNRYFKARRWIDLRIVNSLNSIFTIFRTIFNQKSWIGSIFWI